MARIFIVHAFALTRIGVAYALSGAPDLELVGQSASAAEALRLLPGLYPDAVMIDAFLPDADGIETATRLRVARPGLGVIMLGPAKAHQLLRRTLAAGLDGYLPETADAAALVVALRAIGTGERPALQVVPKPAA